MKELIALAKSRSGALNYGPAGMPANVIDCLYAATAARALQRPEIAKRLTTMGAEVVGGTPMQMGAHLKSEAERWVTLAREVKFELAD